MLGGNQTPIPGPHPPQQGTGSPVLHTGGPILVSDILVSDIPISGISCLLCGAVAGPDTHSAVGPGDPACAQCCGGHSREGRGAGCAGKPQGGCFRDSFTFANLSTVFPAG